MGGDQQQKPVAWMRRWAFENIDVMAMKKAERPHGWFLHEVTRSKLLSDDVPLFATPTPQGERPDV